MSTPGIDGQQGRAGPSGRPRWGARQLLLLAPFAGESRVSPGQLKAAVHHAATLEPYVSGLVWVYTPVALALGVALNAFAVRVRARR